MLVLKDAKCYDLVMLNFYKYIILFQFHIYKNLRLILLSTNCKIYFGRK